MAAIRKGAGLGLAVFVAGLALAGPQVGVAAADPGGADGSSAAAHESREKASEESPTAGPDLRRAATVDEGPAPSDSEAAAVENPRDPFTDPAVNLPDLDPSASPASDTSDAPAEPALAETVADQPAPAEAVAVESAPVAAAVPPTPTDVGPVESAPDATPAPEPPIAAATDHQVGESISGTTEVAVDQSAVQQADRRSPGSELADDPSAVPVSITAELTAIAASSTTEPLPSWRPAITAESRPQAQPAAAAAQPVTARPAASEDETCANCWAFGGSGQLPTGVDQLLRNVAGVVQQVLGAALGFVNSLPANPITEFLAGALLLVHRTLFPDAVLDGCAAAVDTGESGPGGCGGGPLGADVTTRGWDDGAELYPGLGPMYGRSADCMMQLAQNCGGKDLAWVDLSAPSGLPRPRIETYAGFSRPNMPLEEFTGGRFVFLEREDFPVELFESERPGPGPDLYPIARYGGIYAIPSDLNFAGATLTGANFANAYLVGADFSGADLRAANFAGADLTGANLTGANLGPFELSVDPTNYFNRWKYANLRGAIIVDTNFRGSNLQGADFSGAIRD